MPVDTGVVARWASSAISIKCSYMQNYNISAQFIGNVKSPSTTVYVSDGGARYDSSGVKWPVEGLEGCWILDDATDHTTSGDSNWDAPWPRHVNGKIAVVSFIDGHVEAPPVMSWYYGTSSPWLDPAIGGQ